MLGDGIVSFGVWPSAAWDFRNSKSSPKIVLSSVTLSSTCSAAGENSIVPSALRNSTFMLSSLTVVTPPSW